MVAPDASWRVASRPLYDRPIIVFRFNERAAFYEAHRGKMAMRVFMADKIAS